MSKKAGIRMSVTPRGELVVHANPFCTEEAIQRFVKLHAGKLQIEKKESSVRLFGRSYNVKEVVGLTNHVSTSSTDLIIQHKKGTQPKDVYDDFLKQYAQEVMEDITDMIFLRFAKFNLERPAIKLRSMKKSWGIYHPDSQYITLNLELVHYPVEFIEYVICHELVHMIEANHSERFYQILKEVMPDYRRRFDLIETGQKKQYLM